jgi:hypothetical protein
LVQITNSKESLAKALMDLLQWLSSRKQVDALQ